LHRFMPRTGAKGLLQTGANALALRTGANAPFSLGS
jgi:hypothetical protein